MCMEQTYGTSKTSLPTFIFVCTLLFVNAYFLLLGPTEGQEPIMFIAMMFVS